MADFNPLDLLAAAAELKRPGSDVPTDESKTSAENPTTSENRCHGSIVEKNRDSSCDKEIEQCVKITKDPSKIVSSQTVCATSTIQTVTKTVSVALSSVSQNNDSIHSSTTGSISSDVRVVKSTNATNISKPGGVTKVYLNPTTGQRFHVLNVQNQTVADSKHIQNMVSTSHIRNVITPVTSTVTKGISNLSTTPSGQIVSTANHKGRSILTIVKPQPKGSLVETDGVKIASLANNSVAPSKLVNKAYTDSPKPPYMMIRLPAGLSPDVKAATLKSLIPSSLLTKGFKVTTVPLSAATCTVMGQTMNIPGAIYSSTQLGVPCVTPPLSQPIIVTQVSKTATIPSTCSTPQPISTTQASKATIPKSCTVTESCDTPANVLVNHVSENLKVSQVTETDPKSVVGKSAKIVVGDVHKIPSASCSSSDVSATESIELIKSSVQTFASLDEGFPSEKLDNNQNAVLKSIVTKYDTATHINENENKQVSPGLVKSDSNPKSVTLMNGCRSDVSDLKSSPVTINLTAAVSDSILVSKITQDVHKRLVSCDDVVENKNCAESAVKTSVPVSSFSVDHKVVTSTSDSTPTSVEAVLSNENMLKIPVTAGMQSTQPGAVTVNGGQSNANDCKASQKPGFQKTSCVLDTNMEIEQEKHLPSSLSVGDVISSREQKKLAEANICAPVSSVTSTSLPTSRTVGTSPTSKGIKAVVTGFGFPTRLVVKTDSDTEPVLHSNTLNSIPLSQLKHRSPMTTDVKGTTTIVNPTYSYPNFRVQQSKVPPISKYVDNYGNYGKPGQRLPDIKIPAGAKIDHPLRDHDYCYHVFYELAINSHLPEKIKKPRERKRKSTEKTEPDVPTEPKPAKRKYSRKSKGSQSELDLESSSSKLKEEASMKEVKHEIADVDDGSQHSETVLLPDIALLSGNAQTEVADDTVANEQEPRKKRKYVRKAAKMDEDCFDSNSEPVKISGSDNFQDQFIYFATKRLKSRTRDLSKKTKVGESLQPWPYGSEPFGPAVPLGPYASIGGLPSRTPPHPNQSLPPASPARLTGFENTQSTSVTSLEDLSSIVPQLGASEDDSRFVAPLFDGNNGNFRSGLDDTTSKQSIEDLVMTMTPEQIQAVVNLMSKDMTNKKVAENGDGLCANDVVMCPNDNDNLKSGYDSPYTGNGDSKGSMKNGYETGVPESNVYPVSSVPRLSQLSLRAVPAEQAGLIPNTICNQDITSSSGAEITTESGVVNTVLSLVSDAVSPSANSFFVPTAGDEVTTEIVETSDFDDLAQINITPMEPLSNQDFSNINTTPTGAGLFDLNDDILNTSVANMSMLFDSVFTTSPLLKSSVSSTRGVSNAVASVTPERPLPSTSTLQSNEVLPAPDCKSSLFPERGELNARNEDMTDDNGTCAPDLTTVSMYWNTFPALIMRGSQYIRLVDIHKQALPAKDTGLLKKRCQTMGLPFRNCSELQRDFLIRYAYASPSRSTIIVSREVAQTLISSYVNPVPKAAPKRKSLTSSETEEKKTKEAGGKKKKNLNKGSSVGYMTPENEDDDQVESDTKRDLFKVKDAPEKGSRKPKPLTLKLRRVSEIEYIPSARKSRRLSDWEKKDHLRKSKHVDYKRMLIPGSRSGNQEESSQGSVSCPSSPQKPPNTIDVLNDINEMLEMPIVKFKDAKARRDHQKLLEKKLREKIKEEKTKLRTLKKQFKTSKNNPTMENPNWSPEKVECDEVKASQKDVTDNGKTSEKDVPNDTENVVSTDCVKALECKPIQQNNDSTLGTEAESTTVSSTKEAELLLLKGSSELNVGENCEVTPVNQTDGQVKNCEVTMGKLPPLEIVHRDAVHKRLKRGLSQDGDLYFHLYCTENSQCVCCTDCREYFTVNEFTKHVHDLKNKENLIEVKVQQNLELRETKPSEKEEKLWELFLKKKQLLEKSSGVVNSPAEPESKIVTAIKAGIAEMTRLAEEPHQDDRKETRHSSRVRKRKQLYPIEKYTFAKLLPNSAPIVKEVPYMPNIEFQDTVFSELEPRLLPQEIPAHLRKMTVSVSPVKKNPSDCDSCDSTNSTDVVSKYDLSPRTLTPKQSRFCKQQPKVVTEKNRPTSKPGDFTALSCDS